MNIPREMFHVWIGPLAPPRHWMKTWPEKHPDWKYSVFGNEELRAKKFRNQHLIDAYMAARAYAGVADLIRYELLFERGGFALEADAVCRNATDELFTAPADHCYTVYENELFRPGLVSPVFACNQGNEFVGLLIDTLNRLSLRQLDKPWKTTGNLFVGRMIQQHKPKIRIFPSHYFIPKHFELLHPAYTGPDKVYADQMWGSTLGRY